MLITENIYKSVLGCLLAIMLFFATIGAVYLLKGASIEEAEVLTLTVIVAVLTFVVSVYNRRKEDRRLASKDFLEASISMLEKSYEMLQGKDSSPNKVRARWVSCSDLLLSSQNISEKINFAEHKEIWERNKKYWQIKIYDLLHPLGHGLPKEHFREDVKKIHVWGHRDSAPIDLRSIVIIYDFIMDRELENNWEDINMNDKKYSRVFSLANPGISDYFDEFKGKAPPVRI